MDAREELSLKLADIYGQILCAQSLLFYAAESQIKTTIGVNLEAIQRLIEVVENINDSNLIIVTVDCSIKTIEAILPEFEKPQEADPWLITCVGSLRQTLQELRKIAVDQTLFP